MSTELEHVERCVLDACALIAYLNDEAGAESIEELLTLARKEQAQIYVAAVNVYELYYDCLKRDAATAQQLLEDVYSLPLTVIETLDRPAMQVDSIVAFHPSPFTIHPAPPTTRSTA